MNVVTRGDFDGLVAAVLLSQVEKVTDVRLAHPKDVQDGSVEITQDDILVNLPYDARCGMWFDHHLSEEQRVEVQGLYFRGRYGRAPSAARVVYEHYMDPSFLKYKDLVAEADKVDAAQLGSEDVTDPKGWVLLAYTADPRSNLGGDFKPYFQHLMELVATKEIDEILADPEVKRRTDRVHGESVLFRKLLEKKAHTEGNVIVTDLRGMRDLPAGNRFLVYTIFPEANVEIRILDGRGGEKTVFAIGHSIFNRTCPVNVGELCAKHGGGGHKGAGTCQVPRSDADRVFAELLAALRG